MKQRRISLLLILLFCLNQMASGQNQMASGQTDHIGSPVLLPAHPRLLWLKGEEDQVERNIAGDSVWTGVHESILHESDLLLQLPAVERTLIGRRLLNRSREALRRIFFLSYSYRTTKNKVYLRRAEKEMLAVAAFSDWNPSHFLDVAEMTMAVAIGYDWLYDDLAPDSKLAVKRAIIDKGIRPSLDSQYNGWLKTDNNWNQVCNAAMTYGALAVYEEDTSLAKLIINRAVETVRLPMNTFAPDGTYPEGYAYWAYGVGFNVMLISALDKVFGRNFGLSDVAGFSKTPAYMENMTGPSGRPFNYSDAGTAGATQPAIFWFAAKQKDPSLLWVERNRLLHESPALHVQNWLLPAAIIWGSAIHLGPLVAPAAEVWVGQGKNPVALMRTSWTDTSAIFLGLKAGSGFNPHAHMDIGSFVMESDGIRWAIDLGMQDYESLESKGMQIFGRTQDAQRWTIFRYTNQAHNTLTINNRPQLIKGYAPITGFSSDRNFMWAATDLSTVYSGQLTFARRGMAIIDRQYVLVRDEVESADTAVTVRWTLVTTATVSLTGANTATLSEAGKKLVLQVDAPGSIVEMKNWPTDPPPHAYDAPNPGSTSTGFEVHLLPRTKLTLSVYLIPEKSVGVALKHPGEIQTWKSTQTADPDH